jgi:phage shock protein A
MELLYVLIVFALITWIAFSPDPLADTIRARFKGTKARAAKALDDAVDRVEAAEADNEAQLAKANAALVEIKGMRFAIQSKVNVAIEDIKRWNTAAENAASVQKQDLVLEALKRKSTAEAELIPL